MAAIDETCMGMNHLTTFSDVLVVPVLFEACLQSLGMPTHAFHDKVYVPDRCRSFRTLRTVSKASRENLQQYVKNFTLNLVWGEETGALFASVAHFLDSVRLCKFTVVVRPAGKSQRDVYTSPDLLQGYGGLQILYWSAQ